LNLDRLTIGQPHLTPGVQLIQGSAVNGATRILNVVLYVHPLCLCETICVHLCLYCDFERTRSVPLCCIQWKGVAVWSQRLLMSCMMNWMWTHHKDHY